MTNKNGFMGSPEDGYVSAAFLAARFDCSEQAIWRWAREGQMPRPVKLGPNMTRGSFEEVKRWEAEKRDGRN
jgi:predicted DNA-binding transcriptional regulator AlpA